MTAEAENARREYEAKKRRDHLMNNCIHILTWKEEDIKAFVEEMAGYPIFYRHMEQVVKKQWKAERET